MPSCSDVTSQMQKAGVTHLLHSKHLCGEYFQNVLLLVSFGFLLQCVVVIIFPIIHFLFGLELADKEGEDEVLLDNDREEEDDPDHHSDGKVDARRGWVEIDLRELAADRTRNQSKH